MKNPLQNLHFLSLDVAIGAVVNHLVFSKLVGVFNIYSTVILGTSTWLIYILDRLLDNQQNAAILTKRHQFHAKNKQILWFLIIFLGILNFFLIFFLPFKVQIFGLFLVSLTAFYGFLVFRFPKYQPFHKEFFVTFIYAVGVIGTAFVQKKTPLNFTEFHLAFNFLLVVGQSLLLFSWFEILEENNSTKNMVSWLGQKTVKIFLFFSLIIIATSVPFFEGFPQKIAFTETFMAMIFFGMAIFPKVFLRSEIYRPIGEMVFILPVILL